MPSARRLPGLSGVMLAALAACATPRSAALPAAASPAAQPQPGAAAPAAAGKPAAPQGASFSPSGAGAARYGDEPAQAPQRDPLRSGLMSDIERAARSAGTPVPRVDARLHAVADDLARALSGEELPSPELVDFLLSHHGIVEPSPHLVLARTTPGGEGALREGLMDQLRAVLKTGEVLRVGAGVAREGDTVRVVVALQEHRVELEPVPRVLPSGGSTALVGRLLGNLREPHLSVTGPDGRVEDLAATVRGARFQATLRCTRGDGRYQVEIGGNDRFGASVLANFPVFCGAPAPISVVNPATSSTPVASPAEAEQVMFRLVNKDRAAAGLPPVEWDERLAAVARAHSRDMSEHDFVGHVSPRTGDALDRVQRAGIAPTVLMENVGRAYSVEEIQRGLMASPAHRANVLETRARRMGAGIVAGKPEGGLVPLYATQLFM